MSSPYLRNVKPIGEYYAEAFTADNQFGIGMISNWLSLIVLIWLLSLSFLIIRANSSASENRFMAVLIACEGFKAAYHMKNLTPNGHEWWFIDQYLWNFNTTFFISAHVCSVAMYLCFPIYYKVKQLSFLYKPLLQRHVWYVMPLLTIVFMIIAADLWVYENNGWIICSEVGALPTYEMQVGVVSASMQETLDSIGTCPGIGEWAFEDVPIFGFFMVAFSPFVSIIALLIMRTSMKQYEAEEHRDSSNRLTSRSLYIGFLGKVIGNMLFFTTLFIVIPMLGGGFGNAPSFGEMLVKDLANSRGFTDILYEYAWVFTGLMMPLPFAFEGMMFAYAAMKDTVLGIDSKLRRTFRNSIFTGLGAISFLVGSELMESLIGFGALGGVFLGAGILVVRKPIISSLDRFSNKIIPTALDDVENAYLQAYSASGADGVITEAERRILLATADALNITHERAAELEDGFDPKVADNAPQVVTEPTAVQQWTDEAGHTWRSMDDGTIMWWNGTDWQQV
ncbi:MAG: Uncharacterised protein [Methanobacteriota archaeon]|nr:MAG: Uncharacterised protein [Euryarchaeota archaeon]